MIGHADKYSGDPVYRSYIRRKKYIILLVFLMCLAVGSFSLCSGSSGLTLSQISSCFLGKGDTMTDSIVFNIRMPRIVTAMLVGILLEVKK